jgi:hypothetical protein
MKVDYIQRLRDLTHPPLKAGYRPLTHEAEFRNGKWTGVLATRGYADATKSVYVKEPTVPREVALDALTNACASADPEGWDWRTDAVRYLENAIARSVHQ